ncbi:hypothetical protein K461DRAFT_321071 [Myriangium duriaei CBS 260.36]|uniref:F-box domain-containing protein n=1 Tax=Myriangium duriaei CBS 260.36 TaxID=1168546 RepID=A0A9P4J564_9PEZI|nr:hypothetical protein K461DRAFT_321071 [Myriangium duriaei CBS 260.36]
MGLLKHLRSKTKIRAFEDQETLDQPLRSPPAVDSHPARRRSPPAVYNQSGRDYSARLPPQLLQRICSFVCPHSADHSYVSIENSSVGDGCGLCDMRDLARTAQVSRRWYKAAQTLLYTNVRIDAVHYCGLEAVLSQTRSRKSMRRTSTEGAEDVPARRLSLFCRTVRESSNLAQQVEILKLPYMTRETSKGELAATVSVLSNLQYVDLPEGVYDGDASCHTLINELQARCPRIRRMAYRKGAEQYLETLTDHHWSALEHLEISGVEVELSLLRIILGSLPALKSLAIIDLPWINNTIFDQLPNVAPFPRLETLTIEDCPLLTAEGFKVYLSDERSRTRLSKLQLRRTGITLSSLTQFLYDATYLRRLTFIAKVNFSDTLPLTTIPLLSSLSLQTLNFEITDAEGHAPNLAKPSSAFYSYLARSLHSNSLPSLRTLYVRDTTFPDLLLLPPPPSMNGASSSTLARPLEVFSKGQEEAEWIYTVVSTNLSQQHTSRSDPSSNSPALSLSGGRPTSTYSGFGSQQWGSSGAAAQANGFGGYLSIPRDDLHRPRSAGSDRVALLSPPSQNGTPDTSPRVGYQSSRKAATPSEGWPAAVVGSAPGDGRFAGAFSSRPKSLGSPAMTPAAWTSPPMQTGIGSPPSGKFSGLMAKVGVPVRNKPKVQKDDLWRD